MRQKGNLKNYMEINMVNKIISTILISLVFSSFTLNAKPLSHKTKEKVGQRSYLKRCSACHGEGSRGGNLYSQDEWQKIFANSGAELIELHDGEDNVEEIISYIKSDNFKKDSKRMLKFIQEFAYDSELIPTCY